MVSCMEPESVGSTGRYIWGVAVACVHISFVSILSEAADLSADPARKGSACFLGYWVLLSIVA